jgi:hypothetical protein
MQYAEFMEAGYRIFGLYGTDKAGRCMCGNPECNAVLKHPVASNWQHTPQWSDEQIEVMEITGQLATGYGVLVADGLLVVDVDARNGGVQSYAKLLELVPEVAGAGLVVNTGSGGGSQHLYFRIPANMALVQHHDDYKGIDFKSSGFVVGPGSLHASGRRYDAVVGSPYDIDLAPAKLIALLQKPDRVRKQVNGVAVDLSFCEIADMLSVINPDCDHETWYRCGMAVHDATGGLGLDIWDAWSALGKKYPGHNVIEARWHSFGKSSNPVTIGTLMHYAEQAGWQEPVTFSGDVPDFTDYAVDIDAATVDLLRPPGFVGDLVQWINSRSLFPRETLAVAAALMVVSNCAGMRYRDPLDNSAFNLFCFGVADSSTGKEAILQAHNELLKAAGISAALVGGIKSEQEIYRNLIRHQAAYYSIDELGEHFAKISSAQKRGGAVYLEGVIGTLMNIYSKANSFVAITGDLKEEVRQSLIAERTRLQKAVDANEDKNGRMEARLARVDQSLSTIDMGIEHPFLSIFGLTTPEKFNNLMDFELVANGFMGRALIFQELEKNPRIKPRDKRSRQEVPDRIKYTLQNLYAPGYFDASSERVERIGDKSDIQTAAEAVSALDDVSERFWELAAQHAESTGMQAIPRRGYELVAKVSAVLAIPSGLRTLEHVQWAYKLVRRDIEGKMKLAYSNSAPDKGDALMARILSLVTTEHGESVGSLCNQCRAYKKEQVREAVEKLLKSGHVVEVEHKPQRGQATKKIMLAK